MGVVLLAGSLPAYSLDIGDDAARKATVRMAEAFNNDAMTLNNIAWTLVANENLADRYPALALKAAKRAIELTRRKNGQVLDTLARVYYSIGMVDRAITVQKSALAVADDSEKEQAQSALDYCKEIVKVAASVKASAQTETP